MLVQSHHIFELRHRHEQALIHPHMRIDFVELPKIPLALPGEMSFPPSERLSAWGQFLRGPADKALEEAAAVGTTGAAAFQFY